MHSNSPVFHRNTRIQDFGQQTSSITYIFTGLHFFLFSDVSIFFQPLVAVQESGNANVCAVLNVSPTEMNTTSPVEIRLATNHTIPGNN